jgi:hypothetical protein
MLSVGQSQSEVTPSARQKRKSFAGASMKSVDAVKQLRVIFRRNGYVRRQNPVRVMEEGWREYRKGDELRLTAGSTGELRLLRQLLRQAGFTPGRPFVKGRQFRLPVYGRKEVARLLDLIDDGG